MTQPSLSPGPLPERAILAIERVEARYVETPWAYASEHAADIADAWAKRLADKPKLFDGKVLRQSAGRIEERVFHAEYALCDYSAFVHWLSREGDDPTSRNGFALAVLTSADGAFLLGEMAAHTVSGGKIYFPGGTPDPDDILADGSVDLAGSAMRELMEETGLHANEVRARHGFTLVIDGTRLAFLRRVDITLPAEQARRLILERLARQVEPELSDIVVVRGPGDIDAARMPRFVVDFFEHHYRGGERASEHDGGHRR